MHKPESVLENEMHQILWNMKIQMDYSIPARRSDSVLIKKKRTCHQVDLYCSNEINKYSDLARELKKPWNRNMMVIPIVVGALGTVPKCVEKRLG